MKDVDWRVLRHKWQSVWLETLTWYAWLECGCDTKLARLLIRDPP